MLYTQFKHGCSTCRFEQASDLTELDIAIDIVPDENKA